MLNGTALPHVSPGDPPHDCTPFRSKKRRAARLNLFPNLKDSFNRTQGYGMAGLKIFV